MVARLLTVVTLALAGAGCSATSLTHDEQVQMLTAKDRRLQDELYAAQQKIGALTASGAQPRPAAAPEDPFRPAAVRIGRLSGVVDENRPPADQRLRVILEPLDATGDVVKRAGSLELQAFERAPPPSPGPGASAAPGAAAAAGERLYHRWTFSADELAQTWLSGLGTYAYVIRLPWPDARPPAGEAVHVKARFKTLAGQTLEAEADIRLPLQAPAKKAQPSAK
jgi:hypothetical protein